MNKWIFFLVVFCWSVALLAVPEIHIREKSYVGDKGYFKLGDIADVKSVTVEQGRELANLEVAQMPRFGDSLILTAGRLSQILRDKLATSARSVSAEVRLVIPSRVQIENHGQRIDTSDIEPVILGHLKRTCKECDFKVNRVRLPQIEGLSPSARWEIQFPQPLQRGSLGANLVIQHPGGRRESHWVSIQVGVFRKVPVTKRAISIGQRIQAEDFAVEWRDVTLASDATASYEGLVGSLARVGLPIQSIIYANSLVRVQAVNRGEMVKVIAGGDHWSVSTPAVAQQSGYVGDMIRLSNPSSQKTIMGQIIARGVVRVE